MKKTEIQKKFDEIVAFSEVERFLDTPLKHYSSGMQMRLAFAVAAHLEPEILLVDEVLAVGDASFQKKCLGKMKDVAHHGRTIIFVSHNATAMRALCKRAVWLQGGCVVEDGPVDEVMDHYLPKNPVGDLEACWQESLAPGNNRVRLRSVRVIYDESAHPLLTVHTPLELEFMYWNYTPGAVLNLSVSFNYSDESCAFVSISDYIPRPVGLIRQTVQIPGDLLNSGSYHVGVLIVEDTTNVLLAMERIVGFEIAEGRPIGNWYGKYVGFVRPRLEWTSEVIHGSALSIS